MRLSRLEAASTRADGFRSSPQRLDSGIGDAAHRVHDRAPATTPDAPDDECGDQADERPCSDIARVVDADEDPTHADRGGREDERQAETSTDQKHRERDGERCDRVVTRKRRFARARYEQNGLQRMCGEWPLAYPNV